MSLDFELLLCDTQPACLGGAFDEFIFGPRLDNLVGVYCTTMALIKSISEEDSLQNEEGIRVAALYDHEEVGNESAQGAASALTEHILRRLSDPKSYELAMSRSFLISADQAHAHHPNYSDIHEENHRPSLHGGIVLRKNILYNSVSASVLREACRIANVPVQG